MGTNPTNAFNLKWKDHNHNFQSSFVSLQEDSHFIDVTLSCKDGEIAAHEVVLSVCSPYFHILLKDNPCQHPIIILTDVPYADLQDIIHYVYKGMVSVDHSRLSSFLEVARMLQIKGLSRKDTSDGECDLDKKSKNTNEDENMKKVETSEKGTVVTKDDIPVDPLSVEINDSSTNDDPDFIMTEDVEGNDLSSSSTKETERVGASKSPRDESIGDPEQIDVIPRISVRSSKELMTVDFEDSKSESESDVSEVGFVDGGAAYRDVSVPEICLQEDDSGLNYSCENSAVYSDYGLTMEQDIHSQQNLPSFAGNYPFSILDSHSEKKKPPTVPEPPPVLSCEFCGKEYHSKGDLKAHLRMHTGEKPFICNICGTKFARSSHMKRHSYTHTGENPFECPLCKRGFSRRDKLKVHVDRHMEKAAQRGVSLPKISDADLMSKPADPSLVKIHPFLQRGRPGRGTGRPRGRPRIPPSQRLQQSSLENHLQIAAVYSQAAASSMPSPSENLSLLQVPPKRKGPGRPRKNPLPEDRSSAAPRQISPDIVPTNSLLHSVQQIGECTIQPVPH